MQLSQPCRVVNGSAYVELLYVVILTGVTGTYIAGQTLALTGGATGVLMVVDGAELTFAVTSVQQPLLGDTITASGGATGVLSSFDQQPDLAGAGVDGDEWFLRDGDGVAYQIASAFSNSRFQLVAPYGGASSLADEAQAMVHSTRTPLMGLPSFDRRDRNLPVMLQVLVQQLDTILADYEARLVALEP
jgi:hypothetical protein